MAKNFDEKKYSAFGFRFHFCIYTTPQKSIMLCKNLYTYCVIYTRSKSVSHSKSSNIFMLGFAYRWSEISYWINWSADNLLHLVSSVRLRPIYGCICKLGCKCAKMSNMIPSQSITKETISPQACQGLSRPAYTINKLMICCHTTLYAPNK